MWLVQLYKSLLSPSKSHISHFYTSHNVLSQLCMNNKYDAQCGACWDTFWGIYELARLSGNPIHMKVCIESTINMKQVTPMKTSSSEYGKISLCQKLLSRAEHYINYYVAELSSLLTEQLNCLKQVAGIILSSNELCPSITNQKGTK